MRQPRNPSIGLNSCSSRARSRELLRLRAHRLRDFRDLFLAMRQEFVQRRVEQPDRHRQALHDLEQLDEIGALHRQQFCQRHAACRLVVRRGSSRARRGCGPRRRTCARCGTDRCPRRRISRATRASVGVSALARTPSLRTLSAQAISVANSPDSSGSHHRHLAGQHLAGRAVDR